MTCPCGGTGWVSFTGDYLSPSTGNTLKDVEQVVRCPSYARYFQQSPLMRDYPDRCPVPTLPLGDDCPAAIRAHKAIIEAAAKRDADKEAARKRRRA